MNSVTIPVEEIDTAFCDEHLYNEYFTIELSKDDRDSIQSICSAKRRAKLDGDSYVSLSGKDYETLLRITNQSQED